MSKDIKPHSDFSNYKDRSYITTCDPKLAVWAQVCDSKFGLEVQRTPDRYKGVFCIFDLDNNAKLLHSEEVPVAFGAPFGPDAADIVTWMEKAIKIVDAIYEKEALAS